MAKRKSSQVKVYKVTLGTGALIFVKARSKGEARALSEDEMVKLYGKVKYIASIVEATEQDREDFPVFFGKLRASRLPRNPGTDWHLDRVAKLGVALKDARLTERDYLQSALAEERYATGQSRKLGMNPDLTREEKDVLIHTSQGGAVYTGKDRIFWITVANRLSRKGLVRYSNRDNAYVLTTKGKNTVKELGLGLNPGAAWHRHEADDSRRMVGTAFARDNNLQRYYKGKASAHIMSEIVSNQQGMPNPGRKIPWIPLLAGAGLIWLIWRNRKSTVQAVKK